MNLTVDQPPASLPPSSAGDPMRIMCSSWCHSCYPNTDPMRVRLLEPSDRTEWLRLLGELYPAHPVADHILSVDACIAGVTHAELLPSAVFVTERPEGGLCGFLELSVRNYAEGCTGPTPYVESWFVDADLRGRGAGRALMRAAEEWARAQGYDELASDAELNNPGSHAAHAAVGFEEVERAVHFRKVL